MKHIFAGIALVALVASAHAQAPAPNPFSKKTTQPTPVAEVPGSMPGMTPPPAKEPEAKTEKVPANRLGRVGGEYIYRGSVNHTYVYSSADPAIKRVPLDALALGAEENVEPLMEKPPELPSTVGGKTPAQANARAKNTARPPAKTPANSTAVRSTAPATSKSPSSLPPSTPPSKAKK